MMDERKKSLTKFGVLHIWSSDFSKYQLESRKEGVDQRDIRLDFSKYSKYHDTKAEYNMGLSILARDGNFNFNPRFQTNAGLW